ncbi:MAG: class I SAM-dependent methyltransferase [Muribaculaceae bacterium]
MNTTYLTPPEKDPMGQAIADYHRTHRAKPLIVTSSMFDDDEMPVDVLFRDFKHMPLIEQEALRLASGRILDVGAGSGCHALALQQMGKDVCAIDISLLSVEVMRERGVTDARAINLFDQRLSEKFNTILMLMNGAGMMQRIENMPMFFERMHQLLAPGGKIYLDSSDLIYIYQNDDGSVDIDLNGEYYGQVDFAMRYGNVQGESFDWLYLDFDTLSLHAQAGGFTCQLVKEGPHYDYLACLQEA